MITGIKELLYNDEESNDWITIREAKFAKI